MTAIENGVIWWTRPSEPAKRMTWMDQLVKPGMTAVDIGANVGEYTASFRAAVGPSGTVIAIEPHEELTAVITERVPSARLLTAAVTDTEGTTTLYESQVPQHASLYEANVLEPTGRSRTVRAVTLDGLQRSGELPPHVDVIKVDAQGAEVAILRGAQRLIATQRPLWYLELWRDGLAAAGACLVDVRDLLEPAGYRPHEQTWPAMLALAGQQSGHGSIDVVFVSDRGGAR